MSMREMSWALALKDISPACKLVAIYIGNSAAPDAIATIDLSDVCGFACIDEQSGRAAIEELAISTGMSWEESVAGKFECHLPLPSEAESAAPRPPDISPLTLYVMSCGERTKIGITRDLKARRLSIQDFNANPVVAEWSHIGPAYLIRRAERAAHQSLVDLRIHGEWYTIPVAVAIEVARKHMREAGVPIS